MIRHALASPLRSALSSAFAVRRGGGAPAFSLATLFGTDLVTDYQPTVQDLWVKHQAEVAAGRVPLLYRDSAGTTPVTALGQTVGLVLDSSQGINQTNGTIRLNACKRSNSMHLPPWSLYGGVSLTGNNTTAPDGTTTACLLTAQANNGEKALQQTLMFNTRRLSVYAKSNGIRWVGFRALLGSWANCSFDIIDGIIGTVGSGFSGASIVSVGSGWYRISVNTSTDVNLANVIFMGADNTITFLGDGVSGAWFWGADFRTSATAGTMPSLQVTKEYWVDGNHLFQTNAGQRPSLVAGVGGVICLSTDGVDDGMLTASVDLTGTDEVTVFSADRKTSDAAIGTVYEFGPNPETTNGSFGLSAPHAAASASYGVRSRGTALSSASATGVAAPHTAITTQVADVSGDANSLRVNGAAFASSATDQGSGSFGNQPLYVFRRGGSSLPLACECYTIPILVKRLCTPTEINSVEAVIDKYLGVLP